MLPDTMSYFTTVVRAKCLIMLLIKHSFSKNVVCSFKWADLPSLLVRNSVHSSLCGTCVGSPVPDTPTPQPICGLTCLLLTVPSLHLPCRTTIKLSDKTIQYMYINVSEILYFVTIIYNYKYWLLLQKCLKKYFWNKKTMYCTWVCTCAD